MPGLEPSYENIIKQELQIADLKRAYHALMGKAVRLSEYAALLSNAVLRVGEFENETDSWPVYHHAGGINNECSGVIAEFPTERLSRAFVDYHTVANEFLASPDVREWREQEGDHEK